MVNTSAMLPEAPVVDSLRLLFYPATQIYIVQATGAKNANGTPFYANVFMSTSYSLTSSAVGKSMAR